MKYIKNGKLVLDGTIKECDLEEKCLKALEIIVDSTNMYVAFGKYLVIGDTYIRIEKDKYKLLKGVLD